MAALNLEQHDLRPAKKKNTKILKVLLGIGVLVAVPVIGTTLAASINVSGGSIQFGQGVSQAVACDTDGITVTPVSTFTNATGAGAFYLSAIDLSGIAGTCSGMKFTIRVYDDTNGSSPKTVSTGTGTTTAFLVTFSTASGGAATALTEATAGQVDYTLANKSTTGFKINVVTSVAASGVNKITLETS